MAPSTPPPPEASNASAGTTTYARPPFQNPPRPPNPQPLYSLTTSRLPSNPNPNYPQLAPAPHLHPRPQDLPQNSYPLASSGRGFISRPVTRPSPKPTIGFPYLDQEFVRPNSLAPVFSSSGRVIKGIPFPTSSQMKSNATSTFKSEMNGYSELRDREKDDSLAIVRDRKVRLSENASLYTLCRSWIRNGFSADMQPRYLDTVASLPLPLPRPRHSADLQERKAVDYDIEEQNMDKGSCEQLTDKELLQRHIKRAKKIRSLLNEERFKRIDKYKSRLALLLAPNDKVNMGNESAPAQQQAN